MIQKLGSSGLTLFCVLFTMSNVFVIQWLHQYCSGLFTPAETSNNRNRAITGKGVSSDVITSIFITLQCDMNPANLGNEFGREIIA